MFKWLKGRLPSAETVKHAVIPEIFLNEKIEIGWINIYQHKGTGERETSNRVHDTKHKADEVSDRYLMREKGFDRIACVLITFEKGDGIE